MDNVKFEYLGEDREFPGSKRWSVDAIHVTTTRNRRKFTQAELEQAGRSLSFRPLNINHNNGRQLPFPENATLVMDFNRDKMAVSGKFRVTDPAVNAMIETGRINTVSIEQIPTRGETCNEIQCEQHGVAFIGMALLESDVLPGDSLDVRIKPESVAFMVDTIEQLLIPDAQRECITCTDFVKCESCKHKQEQDDACVQRMIKKLSDEDKSKPRDQIIATAFSKCRNGEATKKEAWEFYNKASSYLTEYWNSLKPENMYRQALEDNVKIHHKFASTRTTYTDKN